MSVETLLLLVLFVVLPLIQMLRAARQQSQQQGPPEFEQRRPVPARQPAPPRMQTSLPPEWTGRREAAPERPVTHDVTVVAAPASRSVAVRQDRQSSSDVMAARTRLARGDAAESALQPMMTKEARGRSGTVGLRSPGGLRRAMVEIVILGPCRAVDPHGWRASDTPRRERRSSKP
jgi:hypothetical protein